MTLLIAIATGVFLITDVLFEAAWASLVMALLTGFYVFLWFGIPLSRRMRDGIHERDEENEEDEGDPARDRPQPDGQAWASPEARRRQPARLSLRSIFSTKGCASSCCQQNAEGL
jgi:hypothetical protein